jgi:hypothetical protein
VFKREVAGPATFPVPPKSAWQVKPVAFHFKTSPARQVVFGKVYGAAI